MSWHIRNYNLLRNIVPGIINPKTPGRISSIPPVFDMPICSVLIALPIKIKLVASAMGIANACLDFSLPYRSPAIQENWVGRFGQPLQATNDQIDISKLRSF